MIAFDTNVLVHAAEVGAAPKKVRASRLLEDTLATHSAFLSLQVLAEFYNVARRKSALDADTATRLVEGWCRTATTAPFNEIDLGAAIRANREHKLTVWDALIWATCDRVGAAVLVTEDLQDGRTLGRVTFLNPFNPANAGRLGLT